MKKLITILSMVFMCSTVFAVQYEGTYQCFSDDQFTKQLDVIYEMKGSQTFVNGTYFDLTANMTIPQHWASTSSGQWDRITLVKGRLNGGVEDVKFCKLLKSNGALYPMGRFVPNGQ